MIVVKLMGPEILELLVNNLYVFDLYQSHFNLKVRRISGQINREWPSMFLVTKKLTICHLLRLHEVHKFK